MKWLLIVIVALSLTTFAQTPDDRSDAFSLQQDLTAHAEQSGSPVDYETREWARGFVIGAASAYRYERAICVEDVRNGEVIQVVTKYLNDHPARLHESEVVVVRDALREAYPCPKRARLTH